MATIFMDESGYTGDDLLNTDQPFFTLATFSCSEQKCQEYRTAFFNKVEGAELKHFKLMRNRLGRDMILEFLKEISQTPELVKIHVVNKRYELVRKIVDLIVKPAMRESGNDLRIKGEDISLTYSMYTMLPQLAGQGFFEDLLRHFQTMMVRLNHDSYHEFFDPLFDGRYPQLRDKKEQERLDQLLEFIKRGHTAIGYDLVDQHEQVAHSMGISHSRPLDPALSATFSLLGSWKKEVAGEIVLIHDTSSRMAETINLLQSFIHPFPPSELSQMGSIVGEIYAQDSNNCLGLQFADILAGATSKWLKWMAKGRKIDDRYGRNLDTIIPLFQPSSNIIEPTPGNFEKIATTEEDVQKFDDFIEKLTAFHRMRRYGYFRIFSPEELSKMGKANDKPDLPSSEQHNSA